MGFETYRFPHSRMCDIDSHSQGYGGNMLNFNSVLENLDPQDRAKIERPWLRPILAIRDNLVLREWVWPGFQGVEEQHWETFQWGIVAQGLDLKSLTKRIKTYENQRGRLGKVLDFFTSPPERVAYLAEFERRKYEHLKKINQVLHPAKMKFLPIYSAPEIKLLPPPKTF